MLYGVKDSGRIGPGLRVTIAQQAIPRPDPALPTDEVCVPEKTEPQKTEPPPPNTTAKPSTTEVYARLRSLIIGGEIPPDTKINIVALARDLGVSQTPSIVIIDRRGKARLIEGYVDSDTLTQAVADAR